MDWLRSEDLKEEKNVTASRPIIAAATVLHPVIDEHHEAYHWKMSGINAEHPDSESSDPLMSVLFRDEPDDDEDEEEDEGDGKEDGDDDGYSD